jgi:integrase
MVDQVAEIVYNRYTQRTYRSALAFLVGKKLTRPVLQSEVLKWAGLSKSTIGVRKSALRLFVGTMSGMELCSPDVLDGLRWPHGKPSEKREGLSDEEVEALFDAVETHEERLLLLVMFDTGLRLGTIAKLTFEDLKSESFNVETKRDVVVTVYPTDAIQRVAYIVQRREMYDEWDYAFGDGRKPYYRLLYRMAKRIGERAETPFVPHQARHTFITRLVNDSGDVTIAAQAAGHASVETTMRYRHVRAKQVQDAVRRASIGGEHA